MERQFIVKVIIIKGSVNQTSYTTLKGTLKTNVCIPAHIRNNLYFQELDYNLIQKEKWSEIDLVDWLLASDFYMILSHVHLSASAAFWCKSDLTEQLHRLSSHCGYPYGNELHNPVFCQDKYEYISCLKEMCNPTMKVPLVETITASIKADARKNIARFVRENPGEGKGWTLKAAFSTNSGYNRYADSIDGLLVHWCKACEETIKYSYVIIQECMHNKREERVILHDGKAKYLARIGSPKGTKMKATVDQLFLFAEVAVELLSRRNASYSKHGLSRVDIFERSNGRLIVNEVEGLEAQYVSNNFSHQASTEAFLIQHWNRVFADMVKKSMHV